MTAGSLLGVQATCAQPGLVDETDEREGGTGGARSTSGASTIWSPALASTRSAKTPSDDVDSVATVCVLRRTMYAVLPPRLKMRNTIGTACDTTGVMRRSVAATMAIRRPPARLNARRNGSPPGVQRCRAPGAGAFVRVDSGPNFFSGTASRRDTPAKDLHTGSRRCRGSWQRRRERRASAQGFHSAALK